MFTLLKIVWVLSVSLVGSLWVIWTSAFVVDSISWGFPRMIDVYASIFIAVVTLLFGVFIVLNAYYTRDELATWERRDK